MSPRRFNRAAHIAFLTATLLTGGCYDKIELNELAVVDLMAIDLSDDGRLQVSVQIIVPGELSNPGTVGGAEGGPAQPYYVIEAMGRTLPEALNVLQTRTPRRLFTSHVRVIVLGEAFARAGINAVFDSLTRMRELRITMDVVVTRGRAADLLNATPRLARLPATALTNQLYQNIVPARTVREVVLSLRAKGADVFLPAIRLARRDERVGPPASQTATHPTEAQDSEFVVTGIGVFQGDRLVGFAPRDPAAGLAWLIDEPIQSTPTVEWPPNGETSNQPTGESKQLAPEDRAQQNAPPGTGPGSPGSALAKPNHITPLLLRGDVSFRTAVRDGTIVIRVITRAEDDIITNQAGLDLTDPSVVPALETALSAGIERQMRSMLDLAQHTYKSDVFGFGELIHRNHPKVWRDIRNDWHTVFSTLDIGLDVQVQIRRVGLTSRPANLREEQLRR